MYLTEDRNHDCNFKQPDFYILILTVTFIAIQHLPDFTTDSS